MTPSLLLRLAHCLAATTILLLCARTFAAPNTGSTILIEAEAFSVPGGWVIDQQFMDQMGSPILLAHGMGRPVADARTTVRVDETGAYRVWVRTRDWTAQFGSKDSAGKFQLAINDRVLSATFGTRKAGWHWQDGGTVTLQAGPATLALRDLTGFDGRCDAILLTRDTSLTPPDGGPELTTLRKTCLGLPANPEDAGSYDLVVVGGGIAGAASAIAAARLGLQVALIHDRPVIGGNNSSEVRVHLGGSINLPPYPKIGDIVRELDPNQHGNAQPGSQYDDARKLRVLQGERNVRLFLNTHANGVEKSGKRIAAVLATDVLTGRELRLAARYVADCTGDGTIGALAGADFRYGREARSEYGEPSAPEKTDRMVMGTSVMWYTEDRGAPTAFPETPWAIRFNDHTVQNAIKGDWNWETGLNKDQIGDFEAIRDHGLRAVYGNWSFQKNQAKNREKYATLDLAWVAYVGGKRESRRLMGDLVLREQDITEQRSYPDACVTATWSIDLHYPEPKNATQFPGEEFRTIAKHGKKKAYAIPYRCLYSRNIENLFMAGRNISVTHVALGTVRVMRTTGMMGEVVGMAASVAKRHGTTPRAVYERHFDELRRILENGTGSGGN